MGDLKLNGATSGTITVTPTAVAGTNTITLPASTGTVALTAGPTFSGTVTATTITSPAATALTIQSAGTTAVTIDTSQKVLAGFTSNFFGSRAQFAAASDGSSGYAAAGFQAYNGLNGVVIGNQSGTATYNGIVFVNNGSTQTFVASVQVLASSVVYNTSSDARLKENVQDAEPALNLVDSIQVRSFDWKNTGEHQRYGMIAQELQSVAPEFVNDQLDKDHTLGIDYSKLVPMLTKAIQELSAKNDALEARLAALEAK
jgi:hypothetical protein